MELHPPRRFSPTTLLVIFVPILAFLAGMNIGAMRPVITAGTAPSTGQEPVVLNSRLLREVLEDIQEYYYRPERATSDALTYGAAKGIVDALDDPHTVFLPPDDASDFAQSIDGSLEGIGAELTLEQEILTVNSVLRDTPAQRAGMRAGDSILSIDSESTEAMSLADAIRRIRGPSGTTVTLEVLHRDGDAIEALTITREAIHVPSVEWTLRDDKIIVITLSFFREGTADELTRAAQEALAKNPNGIILDLRNNPGGVLDEAVKVVSLFLADGEVVRQHGRGSDRVYRIENRQIREEQDDASMVLGVASPILQNLPLVVLVNSSSASAAEIVAGALQDHKRGTLVGEQTYGKGTVQELVPIEAGPSAGAELKITVAEWLTPSGRLIDGVGLIPDVEIPLSPEEWTEEQDPQLDAAVSVLTGKPLPSAPPKDED